MAQPLSLPLAGAGVELPSASSLDGVLYLPHLPSTSLCPIDNARPVNCAFHWFKMTVGPTDSIIFIGSSPGLWSQVACVALGS